MRCVLQFSLNKQFLLSKRRAVSRNANKCNLMHVRKKVRPCLSRPPCSSQLPNSITLQNSYANRTINVESKDICLFSRINVYLHPYVMCDFHSTGGRAADGRSSALLHIIPTVTQIVQETKRMCRNLSCAPTCTKLELTEQIREKFSC